MKAAYKIALAGLAVGVSVGYLLLCARGYLLNSAAQSATIPRLRRAIALAPDDSDLHFVLGRQLWLQNLDLSGAVAEYKRATTLNPYPAAYWLELGTAATVAGDNELRDLSIDRAEHAAPYDTAVLWDVANLNLLRGHTSYALQQMRTAMQYSPDNWDRYIGVCWKVTGDVDAVLRDAIPPVEPAYSSLLQLLLNLSRSRDAEKVWRAAESLNLKIGTQEALQYFDFLLAHHLADDAESQWRSFTASTPALAAYEPSDSNLIVNPHFELPVLNAALDWRYGSARDASVAVDPTTGKSGGVSLSIRMDGIPDDSGIYQLVPVKPSGNYSISAFVRSQIRGVDGPRLAAFDAVTNQRVFMSEPVSGDTDWHAIGGTFRTPDQTLLLAVRIIRFPSHTQIRGRMWLDDVSLKMVP